MDDLIALKSVRKPRGQGASRRGEILDAAKRLFLAEGFENATIRKIAATVGVSSATLYVYFPDKDAILRAIAELTFETLLARLEASQQIEGSELGRFRAGLMAYIEFGLAHPDEYRLTFLSKHMGASGPGRQALPCDDVEAGDRSFAILVRNLASLMQAGIFAPAEPVLTAEAVWASLHGLTSLLLDQCGHLESTPPALIKATLDIVVKGLMN